MIRAYNSSDIDRIVALELSTLGTTLGREMLEDSLNNPFSYIYLYEEDNKILGYISFSFDGDIAEMLNFSVDKDYQKRGIGSRLLSYMLDLFASKGAKSSILEVRDSNIRAISLYNKFGYTLIHKRKGYYSNGEDALVLEKRF